jgi:CBS domain-containing protein
MLKIEALMTQNPKCCGPNDTLNLAAQLLWENDCGSLPVVDEKRWPIAVITDRDICMCAYTRGLPLAALPVSTAMSRTLVSCSTAESLVTAEKRMRQHQLYRLPVVARNGRIVGMLSLSDVAREAEKERMAGDAKREVTDQEIAATLGAICSHRATGQFVASAPAEVHPPPDSLSAPGEARRRSGRRRATRETASPTRADHHRIEDR